MTGTSTWVGTSSDGYDVYSDGTNCYIDYTVDGGGFVQTQCPGLSSGNPYPSGSSSGNPYPSVSVNQGGFQVLTTNLDKIMASILSGFAIAKGAPYVPTTTQPTNKNYATPYGTAGYNPYLAGSNVNTGASIQTWLQQNMVVVALGVGAFLLFKSGRK